MSTDDQFNLAQHFKAITSLGKGCDQIIKSFGNRLTTLENSMKKYDDLIQKQQVTIKKNQEIHVQLLNRIQSLEETINNNSIENNDQFIETIPETQYSENNNNQDEETEYRSTDLILNANINIINTNVHNTNNPSGALSQISNNDENINNETSFQILDLASTDSSQTQLTVPETVYEKLYLSFKAKVEKGREQHEDRNFEAALRYYTEALNEFNQSINWKNKFDIPSPLNTENIVAKTYRWRARCLGHLKKYSEGLNSINKCIQLLPNWDKSYSTKGVLHGALHENTDAICAFEKAKLLCRDTAEKNILQKKLEKIRKRNSRKRKQIDSGLRDESHAKRVRYNNRSS
eukprot:352601_1